MSAGIWAAERDGSPPAAGGGAVLPGAGQVTDTTQTLFLCCATSHFPQPVHQFQASWCYSLFSVSWQTYHSPFSPLSSSVARPQVCCAPFNT